MTFDYVTVPEGINVDADIYPLRVGREDERVLYGIDPAFIVEACMERRSALGLGDVRRYVLERSVRRTLERAEGATSRNGIDFLTCIEPIRTIGGHQHFKGGWLNHDFTFTDAHTNSEDWHIVELEDIYHGSTVSDWASPVDNSSRIIGLDELKACYHDLARMSRVLIEGKIKHSACTRVISGKRMFFGDVNEKTQLAAGDRFVNSYLSNDLSQSGYLVSSGLYCEASYFDEDDSWHGTGFADPVYSFEDVDKYKAATALFLLDTYESNGETYKNYYDIVAKPVGKDGSVSFDNSTARSVCLGHRSLQPVNGRNYALNIDCLGVCLAVDLNLKTDISDIEWE